MGSKLLIDQNRRVLVRNRNRRQYQSQRTEDNSICNSSTHVETSKFNDTTIFRQHHSSEVCEQRGKNVVRNPSRGFNQHSGNMQQVQCETYLPPYSKDSEYRSRPSQPRENSVIRTRTTVETVQPTKRRTGLQQVQDRCVFSPQEYETTDVLEPLSRSKWASHRCLQPTIAEKRIVPESSMEADSISITEIERRQSTGSNINNTTLDDSILVEPTTPNEKCETTNAVEIEQSMESSRLDIIRKKRIEQGL